MTWEYLRHGYSLLKTVPDILCFLRNDFKGAKKFGVPLQTRLKAWRYGFNSQSWMWLDLDNNDPEEYLNNIHARRVIPYLNGEYSGVFNDEIAFRYSSKEFENSLPELFGTVDDGVYQPAENKPGTIYQVVDQTEVILKPTCGEQGSGIYKITKENDCYQINNQQVGRSGVDELIGSLEDHVVTAHIDQHEYADQIFDETLNTIRIVTVIDPKTRSATVAAASHRFGTSESKPTDNWSAGGSCAPIDVDTGRLGKALCRSDSGTLERVETHPETQVQISNVEIPAWHDICSFICDFAEHHKRGPYVGWDVSLTDTGPVVIEANSNPGINIVQIDRGMLTSNAVKRVFEEFNCDP